MSSCPDRLSLIIPCYNEQEVLPAFYQRTVAVLTSHGFDYELVFVNDGSKDDTLAVLYALHETDPRVCIIDLSRNFGKEIAMTAGLDFATGDAMLVIDADLQDPPELIPLLVAKWKEGNDVVFATRAMREGETLLKRFTARTFYRLARLVTRINLPENTGDFRLMNRRSVDGLRKLKERHRFMKGLFTWIGFQQTAVFYRREPRYAGKTKWNYWKLWNFAIEGITSISIGPLQISSYLGVLIAFFSFIYASFLAIRTIIFGVDVPGYASLMVTLLFLSGIQLTILGVIGEYLGRMFNETKQRPLYLTKDCVGFSQTNEAKDAK